MPHHLEKRFRRQDARAFRERRLWRIALGQNKRPACAARRKRHGEGAAYRPELAGQREFTGKFLAGECFRWQLSARRENAERDWQVEAARVLRQFRRREIHGDASRRKFEVPVVERCPHAIACFAHFGVGQADDVKRRQSRPQVNFDRHFGRVDAYKRAARHGRDSHDSHLSQWRRTL